MPPSRVSLALLLTALAACSESTGPARPDAGGVDSGVDAGSALSCGCAPGIHQERIIVLSDDGEIWSYDPFENAFAPVGEILCAPPGARTFSMAVDDQGRAWALLADSGELRIVDVNDPTRCDVPDYRPTGAFRLFGMSFANRSPEDPCGDLYVQSYSGDGPFRAGEDLGSLGVLEGDPAGAAPLTARVISRIDYDGGELAGTRDGRLYAFTGEEPPELVEFDKATGAVLGTRVLEGFSKTFASAFAFYGGYLYFFTEAPPPACEPCLADACPDAFAACLEDPVCIDAVRCASAQGDVSDECGGLAGADMLECLGACEAECFPARIDRVSRVTRLDLEVPDTPLVPIEGVAPIRVVGAGASTCVPLR